VATTGTSFGGKAAGVCLYLGRPRLLFSITTFLQLCTLCVVEREMIVSDEVRIIRPRMVVLRSVIVGTKKFH
jgi:hypothetical protein